MDRPPERKHLTRCCRGVAAVTEEVAACLRFECENYKNGHYIEIDSILVDH